MLVKKIHSIGLKMNYCLYYLNMYKVILICNINTNNLNNSLYILKLTTFLVTVTEYPPGRKQPNWRTVYFGSWFVVHYIMVQKAWQQEWDALAKLCYSLERQGGEKWYSLSFSSFTQAKNPSTWDKGWVFFPQLNLSGKISGNLKDLPRGVVPRWSKIFPSWQSRLAITRFYTSCVVYCVYTDFGGTRTYVSCPGLTHLLWLLPQRPSQSST